MAVDPIEAAQMALQGAVDDERKRLQDLRHQLEAQLIVATKNRQAAEVDRRAAAEARAEMEADLEEERRLMGERFSGSIVDLDCGGTVISTLRHTVEKAGGLLEAVVSGRHSVVQRDGRFFIDADPRVVRRILTAVTTGTADELLHDSETAAVVDYLQVDV